MNADVQVWMASKEVADKLNLHVRTLRNWLEMFVPRAERLKNPQGHYLISETGFYLLKEVKERKEAGNVSLLDIKQKMVDEGLLSAEMLVMEETAIGSFDNSLALSSNLPAQPSAYEIETAIQEALFSFKQELTLLSSLQQLQNSILEKIVDIEEMQESLRLEMRRVTFEMDLMQQRLTRRKNRQDRTEGRFSLNPFRWFSRHTNNA